MKRLLASLRFGAPLGALGFGLGLALGLRLAPSMAAPAKEQVGEPVEGGGVQASAPPEVATARNPWHDEGENGVYIVQHRDPPAVEDDAGLRQRVGRFLQTRKILAARNYAPEGPGNPKGPIDVYAVWNPADVRTQLHAVHWMGPSDRPSEVVDHLIYTAHLATCSELVFLDVDGDGRREVVTIFPGANVCRPAILDLTGPAAPETKDAGLEPWPSLWWKLADLEGDGRYEAVTQVGGQAVRRLPDALDWPEFAAAEGAYLVYALRGHRWHLDSVLREDPTQPPAQ